MTRLLWAFALAAALATPGLAMAASTVAAPPPAVEVQMWPSEAEGALLLVTGTAPTGTPLPYELRLPLPAGAEVVWSGEVTGGGAATDIQRPHTVVDGTGAKVVVFTLSRARIGQYEALLASPTVEAGRYTSVLDWVQSTTASTVDFSVKFATTAGGILTDPAAPGEPVVNAAGERLYALPSKELARGAAFKVTTSFTRAAGAGTGVGGGGGGSATTILIVLGAMLVVAAGALVYQLGRRGGSAGGPPEQGGRGSAEQGGRRSAEQGAGRQRAPEPTPPRPLSDDPFDLD